MTSGLFGRRTFVPLHHALLIDDQLAYGHPQHTTSSTPPGDHQGNEAQPELIRSEESLTVPVSKEIGWAPRP